MLDLFLNQLVTSDSFSVATYKNENERVLHKLTEKVSTGMD